MKTVIITGAAGFIGSHLTDAFLKAGDRVIGIDNLMTGSKSNLKEAYKSEHFEFIEANVIESPEKYLPKAIYSGEQKIDLVLHFASPASPPGYQREPIATYQVNSFATHNLLAWISSFQPQARFLFASTSEVYGDPAVHPQPESYWGNVNPNGIRSCYDEGKRLGETICGVFTRQFNLDIRIVRIFNTYGPRMDIYDGRIMPNLMLQALTDKPLTVYGNGSQTRSYCFVSDLVEGIKTFVTLPELSGKTLNLGNADEHTVLETAEKVAEIAKMAGSGDPKIEFKPLPADDPTRRKPDLTLAEHFLNYRPQVTLSEGMQKTWQYFKDYLVTNDQHVQ